jgi:hypothetical protein
MPYLHPTICRVESDQASILGFAAGTPLLTPDGVKRIEELQPSDVIQTKKKKGQRE